MTRVAKRMEKINDTFRCLADQAINQSVNIFISRTKDEEASTEPKNL